MVLENIGTGEIVRIYKDVVNEFQSFLARQGDIYFVGHNAIHFDIPVINRICSVDIPNDRIVDTMVLSYLYNPHIAGGHSLDAWGKRFGLPKLDFDDWSDFTAEMLTYCERDVKLTTHLFKKLTARMVKMGFSEQSAKLEHDIADIIDRQTKFGWWFDVNAGNYLYNTLRDQEEVLRREIHELFPPVLKEQGTYTLKEKADGTYYKSYYNHLEKYPSVETDFERMQYTCYDYEEFNIGSPKQRIERLLELGWKPTEFTPTGLPKVNEETIVRFAEQSGRPQVKAIAEWLVHNSRANMVNNWLESVGPDQRIHGRIFSCGAASRRMRHSSPNTANIPRNTSRFGLECRALWAVPPGRVLVGYDASGLESRTLLHYLNNQEAEAYFLEGDIHQKNADAVGIDRTTMKTLWYAFLYGAMDPKLGSIVGGSKKDGMDARRKLESSVPGLKRLVTRVTHEFDKNNGILKTIDGGFTRCPKKSAALNYKCQSAGGIIMKMSSIILDRTIQAYEWDAIKVGDIHDEGQIETDESIADDVGQAAVESIRESGRRLQCAVELDGDYSIGANWSETH